MEMNNLETCNVFYCTLAENQILQFPSGLSVAVYDGLTPIRLNTSQPLIVRSLEPFSNLYINKSYEPTQNPLYTNLEPDEVVGSTGLPIGLDFLKYNTITGTANTTGTFLVEVQYKYPNFDNATTEKISPVANFTLQITTGLNGTLPPTLTDTLPIVESGQTLLPISGQFGLCYYEQNNLNNQGCITGTMASQEALLAAFSSSSSSLSQAIQNNSSSSSSSSVNNNAPSNCIESFNGVSLPKFISGTHCELLGRPPSSSDYSFYLNSLIQGSMTKADYLYILTFDEEFIKRKTILDMYYSYRVTPPSKEVFVSSVRTLIDAPDETFEDLSSSSSALVVEKPSDPIEDIDCFNYPLACPGPAGYGCLNGHLQITDLIYNSAEFAFVNGPVVKSYDYTTFISWTSKQNWRAGNGIAVGTFYEPGACIPNMLSAMNNGDYNKWGSPKSFAMSFMTRVADSVNINCGNTYWEDQVKYSAHLSAVTLNYFLRNTWINTRTTSQDSKHANYFFATPGKWQNGADYINGRLKENLTKYIETGILPLSDWGTSCCFSDQSSYTSTQIPPVESLGHPCVKCNDESQQSSGCRAYEDSIGPTMCGTSQSPVTETQGVSFGDPIHTLIPRIINSHRVETGISGEILEIGKPLYDPSGSDGSGSGIVKTGLQDICEFGLSMYVDVRNDHSENYFLGTIGNEYVAVKTHTMVNPKWGLGILDSFTIERGTFDLPQPQQQEQQGILPNDFYLINRNVTQKSHYFTTVTEYPNDDIPELSLFVSDCNGQPRLLGRPVTGIITQRIPSAAIQSSFVRKNIGIENATALNLGWRSALMYNVEGQLKVKPNTLVQFSSLTICPGELQKFDYLGGSLIDHLEYNYDKYSVQDGTGVDTFMMVPNATYQNFGKSYQVRRPSEKMQHFYGLDWIRTTLTNVESSNTPGTEWKWIDQFGSQIIYNYEDGRTFPYTEGCPFSGLEIESDCLECDPTCESFTGSLSGLDLTTGLCDKGDMNGKIIPKWMCDCYSGISKQLDPVVPPIEPMTSTTSSSYLNELIKETFNY